MVLRIEHPFAEEKDLISIRMTSKGPLSIRSGWNKMEPNSIDDFLGKTRVSASLGKSIIFHWISFMAPEAVRQFKLRRATKSRKDKRDNQFKKHEIFFIIPCRAIFLLVHWFLNALLNKLLFKLIGTRRLKLWKKNDLLWIIAIKNTDSKRFKELHYIFPLRNLVKKLLSKTSSKQKSGRARAIKQRRSDLREKSGTTFLLRNFFRHFGDGSWIFFLLKASYVRLSNNGIAGIIRIQLSTAAAKLLVDQRCSC